MLAYMQLNLRLHPYHVVHEVTGELLGQYSNYLCAAHTVSTTHRSNMTVRDMIKNKLYDRTEVLQDYAKFRPAPMQKYGLPA